MVYEYDDSYEGFLCCIYESYVNKEFPIAFFSNEEFSVLTLYAVRCVKTDLTHSSRILRSIESRSARAARLLYRAFHTCMADREACLYRFIQKLYADGPQFLRRTSDEACFPLYKAVRHLSGELEKLRGFVRFSDFGGILGAEIEPKNRVLPFLRGYFCSRYANEPFFCMTAHMGNCFYTAEADLASCRSIPSLLHHQMHRKLNTANCGRHFLTPLPSKIGIIRAAKTHFYPNATAVP